MLLARILAVMFVVAAFGGGTYFLFPHHAPEKAPIVGPIATPDPQDAVIGKSVEGREIHAYTYGKGATRVVFVGGMHGGYEWNAVLLAYQFMDYLVAHPETIPTNESISVIPDLNPDAVFKAIGKEGRFTEADVPKKDLSAARFNADGVDLNRNFDCHWQPKSTWQNKTVSAGTAPFSEPEAQAMRDFAVTQKPSAVIFWHSAAGSVYASECDHGILPQDLDIMTAYATAAKYPAVKSFDAYPVTGDSEGWLASINIPALTVELSSHDSVEWDRNLAGIEAVLTYYAQSGTVQTP